MIPTSMFKFKHGTWSAFATKKIMLLHKITCRLNIHDENRVFVPEWKEHDTQAQIKQDIVISARNEHARDSTHKRRSNLAFSQNIAISHVYTSKAYQENSYTSLELTSMIISSHPTYHSDQWYERSISSKAYDTNVVYDTKMLTMICYTNETCRMHMYMRYPTHSQKG
jgi:hypothetical protein